MPKNILNKFEKRNNCKKLNAEKKTSTASTTSKIVKNSQKANFGAKKSKLTNETSNNDEHGTIQILVLNEKFVASTVLFAVGDALCVNSSSFLSPEKFVAKNQKISRKTVVYWVALQSLLEAFRKHLAQQDACRKLFTTQLSHSKQENSDDNKVSLLHKVSSQQFVPHFIELWSKKCSAVLGTEASHSSSSKSDGNVDLLAVKCVGMALGLLFSCPFSVLSTTDEAKEQVNFVDLLVATCVELVIQLWFKEGTTSNNDEMLDKVMSSLLFCSLCPMLAFHSCFTSSSSQKNSSNKSFTLSEWPKLIQQVIVPKLKSYCSFALSSAQQLSPNEKSDASKIRVLLLSQLLNQSAPRFVRLCDGMLLMREKGESSTTCEDYDFDPVSQSLQRLISCEGKWQQLVKTCITNQGSEDNSDENLTNPITLSLWGSLKGFNQVPETFFRRVQLEKELTNLSCDLLSLLLQTTQ